MDSSETSGTEISMFSETASSEANDYEELQTLLALQFPKCPFHISCVDSMHELEHIFSEELVILIFDDRLNQKYYKSSELTAFQKNKLRHYTVVKKMNNEPIRVRHVLNAMIKDGHYHSRKIEKHFGNDFLEKFIRHPNNMYETVWGN